MTTSAVTTRTVEPSNPMRARLVHATLVAPERIVLIMVALAIAAGATVSLGAHQPWTVLPLAVILVALAWKPLSPVVGHGRAHLLGAAIALGGTAVWTVINVAMAAEYLIVVRDPGFLTLSGMWLVDHPHTDIPAGGSVEAAALQVNMLADAEQAWNLRGDSIQPQGAKMLPATIAIGGWVAGQTGVLSANVVIGAVGLLAVYALARRFMGPLAALAPAGALGLTVAHIGLSRAAYSEPLTLLLVITGVLWAWRGVTQQQIAPLLAAGVVTGATTLIRIDGASFALGALAGVVVALSLSTAPRGWRRHAALTFGAVQAATVLAGYLALWRWSEAYVSRLENQAQSLVSVYALCALATGIWVLTWAGRVRGDRILSALAQRAGRRGAIAVGAAVTLVLAVLASRPLWTTVHRGTELSNHRFANGVVENFQRSHGLPVEGTRTYAEHTVTWISYYFTWPLVVLGIIGFGVMAYRMIRKDSAWAVFLGAILAPSLLYFWNPSIIPDQLWAIRRFEPATIPGFALAAGVGAWFLATRPRNRDTRTALRRGVAALMIAAPLTTWISIVPADEFPLASATPVTTREMIGSRDQLSDLCDVVDGRPIVLAGESSHFGSLRVMCDVPVVLALAAPSTETLTEMTQLWGEAPVVLVLSRNADWFEWDGGVPAPVVESQVNQAGYSLQRVPRDVIKRNYEWLAGVPDDQGTLVPVPTAAASPTD